MMGKDKYIHKLYAFALAAVFALTLAGCGGGGGGTTAAPDPEPPAMPEPTPQEMCEGDGGEWRNGACVSAEELAAEMAEAEALSGAQDAAMAAYMAAMAAVSGAKDPVAMGNAQPHAAMAKEASDMAAAATTSEMAMEYQMKAEMYRDMAMEAAGMRSLGLTTLANKITNQSAIDNAVLEGRDPDDPVSNAGRVGDALHVTRAADPAVADTPAVTGPPALDAVAAGSVSQGGTASARATYGASGPSITVSVNIGGTDTALQRGETPMLLTTRGGWMGRELLVDDTSDTYANVYTDIQADTPGKPVPGAVLNALDGSTPLDTAGLLGTITETNNPVITGDPGDGSTFSGTFNQDPDDDNPPVSGVFTCPDDTACAIATNDDGEVVNVAGYTFNAASTETNDPTPDTDYLAWGVWLTVPDAAPDPAVAATNATAGAFASGNDVFTVNATLKGTATYNGVATGIYSAGGMVEYFDADVMLEANFGGTVGADSTPATSNAGENDGLLLGAVTGTVSNIKAGGMDVEGSLALNRATILSGAPGSPSSTPNDPSTMGFMSRDGNRGVEGTVGGDLLRGRWGGQFYGPNATDSDDDGTTYPTTAAGTFGASSGGTTPIRLLGAFGAWKAE